MNKKGYIKTLEAVIAIIMLLGFVLFIMSNTREKEVIEKPFVVRNAQNFILDQILYNDKYRECIDAVDIPRTDGACVDGSCVAEGGSCIGLLNGKVNKENVDCKELIVGVNGLIPQFSPVTYDFYCEICKIAGTCTTEIDKKDCNKKDCYTDARFIGYKNKQIKVVRLYLWEK